MELLPAELYGKIDKRNPVVSSFESEIKEFTVFMKRISSLFEIWTKYKVRLPAHYFQEQMVQIADFLYDMKFHALQARCLCAFKLEKEVEEHPSQKGLGRLQSILDFLRILMQAVLPYESLCWVLYNGSVQIYSICRYLMSANHSAQALDFLLWACMCLETSVPLLTIRFLPWRATLYCAVCQCYYDCRAGLQAEVFARRALGKVNELAKLEEMSCSPASSETTMAFREATIKLAAMLFKRVAYEPGRKSKGVCRPKQKGILKEAPWHRTITERLLMEMFEGHAAQLLAVIEALWDTSHRPLHTGIPEEPEMREVVMELLSVGTSLNIVIKNNRGFCSAVLFCAGKNTVSVEAAVKFVKLLFLYGQWDMFRCLSGLLVPHLKVGFRTGGFGNHVYVCVYGQDVQPDRDLVIDIMHLLWARCKAVIQSVLNSDIETFSIFLSHSVWHNVFFIFLNKYVALYGCACIAFIEIHWKLIFACVRSPTVGSDPVPAV
uniref:Cilia and flagella associated protein 54 n=1 Tax=Scleropages formosus TaxID=113540 RepID=A0A8C9RCS4_SCLFO